MNSENFRGYLREDWRIFHSRDQRDLDFDVHAHSFHKVIICLSGHVDYAIEGTGYRLGNGDVLVIPAGQLHRSVLNADEVYERFVLWIRPSTVEKTGEDFILRLFDRCILMRGEGQQWEKLLHRLSHAEKWWYSAEEGHLLLAWTYLVQALFLMRGLHRGQAEAGLTNPRLGEMIRFIADHPAEDLSVEKLCTRFYISPSGLMHSFKKYTGCSVHAYIQKKRLHHAATLIRSGEKAIIAAESSGFADYSAFLKAFRKEYGVSPQQLRNGQDTLQ